MKTLYIVATPIGNLRDITSRALETLKDVNVVLAEDTRVTKKLLSHYDIKKEVKRYDEHVGTAIYSEVKKRLENGESIALVTDAGTPGISDPGSRLVDFVRGEVPDAKIVPIPGPSALIAALSASGVGADQFTFLGFPPHKKGRQTFFKKMKSIETRPIVFYESTHRIEKAFAALGEIFGDAQTIVVARELTKIYEEAWRGSIKNARGHFTGERKKGEFVVIVP